MGISGISRRKTLTGAAVVGVGVPFLAACGSDDGESDEASAPEVSSGEALGSTGDVPVGGGTIYADQEIVVTQPTEGDFKAFSAVCTHQSCLVTEVKDGTIDCACHGSKFSIQNGAVEAGPAPSPLAAVKIAVDGDQITTA